MTGVVQIPETRGPPKQALGARYTKASAARCSVTLSDRSNGVIAASTCASSINGDYGKSQSVLKVWTVDVTDLSLLH